LHHPEGVHSAQWVKLKELDQWSLARNVRELIALAQSKYSCLKDA
jgi:hypothetical protein